MTIQNRIYKSPCGRIELREGRWQDALADISIDVLLTDPPYGEKTHSGQRHRRRSKKHNDHKLNARGLEYKHWTSSDVRELVAYWSDRTTGWIACMTSHDLIPAYEDAFLEADRYQFAPLSCIVPIACIQDGMNVRLAGDGPSNWTVHLMVGRPRSREFATWGTLRGGYHGSPCDEGENRLDRSKRAVAGGKPLWLGRALVRDYSRPDDLVCDPCVGGGTFLLAAAIEGRRAIGAECNPNTYELAVKRLKKGYTPSLFGDKQKKRSDEQLEF